MEFRQLRYFIEINKKGSFSKAAAGMGLTQPALSRQISLLEREIGQELLIRSGRSLSLTPAGEKLLLKAVQLNDLWHDTLDSLTQAPDSLDGEYTISSGGTVAAYILPGVIRKIRKKNPGVSFHVREGDSRENLEAVTWGDVELGILTGQTEDDNLVNKFFLTDRIIPVVSRNHPLVNRPRLKLEDLKEEEFVYYHPASAIRQEVEKNLKGFSPRISMELRSVESVIKSVEAGLGIGFISEFALTPKLKALPLPELTAERQFYFCYRKHQAGLVKLVEAILEAI